MYVTMSKVEGTKGGSGDEGDRAMGRNGREEIVGIESLGRSAP